VRGGKVFHPCDEEERLDAATFDQRVRRGIYERFAESGRPPAPGALAEALSVPPTEVDASLRRLADAHLVMLAGGGTSVWMANPFSAVPTDFEVRSGDRRWWGNCIWDGLGILAMLGVDGQVATWCHDCGERLVVGVAGGRVAERDWVVHFAVPAARWWEDIGFT
jgi:alkylmercury lyase-like protein